MKLILAIAICLSSMTSSFAQNNTSAFLGPNKNTVADTAAKPKILQFTKTFELEVDPLAYVLNGYSVHGSYNYNHFKYDVGFYGIQVPTELDNNKNFTTKSIGFGLKVAYLFKYVNGFYIAFDGDFLQNDVTAKKTGEKDKGHNVGLGIDAGYRFFLFPNKHNALSGLYLTPWVGVSHNIVYDKIKLADYKESVIGYYATVHIGYRF